MEHPYSPPTASIPHYVPNTHSHPRILTPFLLLIACVVLPAWVAGRRLRRVDRFAASWFALSGFLHLLFEGYYVLHHDEIAGMNTLFAQLWKEYSLSDSRYLTSDPFTVCIEGITAVVLGPLSFLTSLATLTLHPARHILRTIVCVAHIYGLTLYFATNHVGPESYSRPEGLYFWVYYVGLNALWAFVPLFLLGDSWAQVVRAFNALELKRD